MSVQLKLAQKVVKINISNVNVRSIAIIFKLDQSKPIYIVDEADGQVVIPRENGEFDIMQLFDGATYHVEGEEMIAQQLRRHQPPGVTNSNLRPRFTFISSPSTSTTTSSTAVPGNSPKVSQWRKTIMFSQMDENRKAIPLYQVYLTLNDELASVEKVKQMVEEEVGVSVVLVDNKLLEIKTSTTTNQGDFWKGSRKILAIPSSQYQTHAACKRSAAARSDDESNIINEIKKMREDLKKNDTVNSFIAKVFHCSICQTTATLPAAICNSCQKVIGCVPCAEQWKESSPRQVCPLCRSSDNFQIMPVLRDIQDIIQDINVYPTLGRATATPAVNNEAAAFLQDNDELVEL